MVLADMKKLKYNTSNIMYARYFCQFAIVKNKMVKKNK